MSGFAKDSKKPFFGYLPSQKNIARTWVLVIHHGFEHDAEYRREGNQEDLKKLHDTFVRRNCRFRELKSKTREEILSNLESSQKFLSLFKENGEAQADKEEPDLFILIILTHGRSGGTILTDHREESTEKPKPAAYETYRTDDVWNRLNNIEQLRNSIKLIFFGPCRGDSDEIRLPATQETLQKNPVSDKSMWFSIQPNLENFIIFYSTVEDVRAQRNTTGTWLVSALCTELDSMEKDADLIVFLTRVKRLISDKTTITNEISQTPQLQCAKHDAFIVSSFPLKEASDSASNTPRDQLVTTANIDYYSWKSKKGMPFRRGRALIFHDQKHAALAKGMEKSLQFLDFETQLCSTARIVNVVNEVASARDSGLSEDGAIIICVFARLIDSPERGLTIATAEGQISANQITRSFIGIKSSELAGKPKLFFFLDGGFRDDCFRIDNVIALKPSDFVVEGNNHEGIFTFFAVAAKAEEDNIVTGLINELQNHNLKNGLSLQEAIVILMRRYEEPVDAIKCRVVSTLAHLVDFRRCRNAYIEPTFTVERTDESISCDHLLARMVDAALKPQERFMIRSWLVRSSAGMGKSAAMQHFAKKLRELLPGAFLVLSFSFKNCIEYFRDLRELDNSSPDSYIGLLEKAMAPEDCKALRSNIREQKVFLLADGFDEICPEYEETASELIRQVRMANLPIWITTRIHGERNIRNKIAPLDVLDLRPLKREEQIKLLKTMLFKGNDECAALLDKFNGNGKNDFTGTPLQLKMIAGIGDQVQQLDGGLNSLYHQFVLSKISFYLEGFCGTNKSHKSYESSLRDNMDLLIELTVESYFPRDERLSRELIRKQQDINHIGIVNFSMDEERKLKSAVFEHQTYAEFLLSAWFLFKCGHNLGKLPLLSADDIDHIEPSSLLLQGRFDQVRSFIDSFFLGTDGERRIQATRLQSFVQTSELRQRKIDLMSFVCKEGLANLFKLIFESNVTEEYFGDIQALVNTPFEYDFRNDTYKYYPLYAACFSDEKLALHLLKLGARLDLLFTDSSRTDDGSTILHLAAKRNLLTVVSLIAGKFPKQISKGDVHGVTPLDHASRLGHLDCLKILIDGIVSEEEKIEMRKRALHFASTGGHTQMVLYLMGTNFDVKQDNYELSPLYNAAEHGKIDLMRALLEIFPDANGDAHSCVNEWTAAHAACMSDQLEALKILHEHGAKLSARLTKKKYGYGFTPLHTAATNNSTKCIAFLLDQGVDIETRDTYFGESAFHLAAAHGQLEALRLLKERQAFIYAKSNEHKDEDWAGLKLSALDKAAINPHVKCLDFLLGLEFTDEMRKQAMWYAFARGDIDYVQNFKTVLSLFVEKSGNRLSVNEDLLKGQTPMIVLARRSPKWNPKRYLSDPRRDDIDTEAPFYPRPMEMAHPEWLTNTRQTNLFVECIKHLIEKNADVNRVAWNVGGPLHIAAGNGDVQLLEVLLRAGAQPSSTFPPLNLSPLHCAARNGHLEVVQILAGREGVDINCKSFQSESPVQLALAGGHTAVFEYLLLNCGANVTSIYSIEMGEEYTLASKAAEMGLRRELEMILGVVPFEDDQKHLDWALVGAAKGERLDLLRDLVQMGANPTQSNLTSNFFNSPLTVATLAKKVESMETLFELIDEGTRAEEASIALGESTVRHGYLKFIKILVERGGADINRKNKHGFSPIATASFRQFDDIVGYLLSLERLNLLDISSDGKSPETYFSKLRNEILRQKLFERLMFQRKALVDNA